MESNNSKETVASYPDPNIPNEQKDSVEYILPYLKTAYYDFVNNQYEGYSNRGRKIRNKRYRLGEEDVSIYKTRFTTSDDVAYSNLDFTPINIISKFVDVSVNSILDKRFKIKVKARDTMTLEEENKYTEDLMGQMLNRGVTEKMSNIMGKDFTVKDAPTSNEEILLRTETEYNDNMEIALEQGIREVRKMSDVHEIDRYVVDDLVTCGEGVEKVYLMENGEIKYEYIDSVNFIRSFSKQPDNRRLKHAGHVTTMTLAELRRRVSPEDGFTEKDWEEIAERVSNRKSGYKAGTAVYANNSSDSAAWYDSLDVDVVEMEFVDFNYDKYEYKENSYGFSSISHRDDDYQLPENSKAKRELVTDSYEVVYKGSWIVGTDYLFDWGKAHNISINSGDFYTANLSYIVYTMYGKSIVEKIIPFAEQIQLIYLKLQQLAAKVRPSGVAIDVTVLESAVRNGAGGYFEPLELSEIVDQTGTIYYRGDNEDPEMRGNRQPITQINTSVRDSLQSMVDLYNHYMNQIRDISGINEYKDGTNTNPNTLVGVQSESIRASNNATAAINSAYYNIVERSSSRVVEFFQDVLHNDEASKKYERILGSPVMETLERIKEVPIDMIAVDLEFEPTEQEQAVLNKHIELALQSGAIEIEDSLMIRDIDNVSLAIRVLVQKKKKKAEAMQKAMAAQAEQETAKVQQEAQMEVQKITAEAQIKAKVEVEAYQAKAQIDFQLKQQSANIEFGLSQQVIDGKIKVAEIGAQASTQKMNTMEDRKDSRDKSQKTMESKLIEQRKDRVPEQDFTAEDEATLDRRIEQAVPNAPNLRGGGGAGMQQPRI